MKTRFIYLLETIRKQPMKKNGNNKIVQTDELELQSRNHELVRPNTPPPLGTPTALQKRGPI